MDAIAAIDEHGPGTKSVQDQALGMGLAHEFQEFGEDPEDGRQRDHGLLPPRERLSVRPGKDDDRLGLVIVGEGERVAGVGDFQQVDRLGPQVAGTPTQDAADLAPGQCAAAGNIRGVVEKGIANGAQEDIDPFGLVGFAQTVVGEVEVVEDLLARIEPEPGCFGHQRGHDVPAGLLRWAGTLQAFADSQVHGRS